jgi:hypothetical protein
VHVGICSSTSHSRSGDNCQQWLSTVRKSSFSGSIVMIVPRGVRRRRQQHTYPSLRHLSIHLSYTLSIYLSIHIYSATSSTSLLYHAYHHHTREHPSSSSPPITPTRHSSSPMTTHDYRIILHPPIPLLSCSRPTKGHNFSLVTCCISYGMLV